MKTLKDYGKEFNGIHFIYIEEAEDLIKNFNRKNRKINNNIEYKMNDAKTQLYSITRDTNGWCGDFIINVTTKEEYLKALKKN